MSPVNTVRFIWQRFTNRSDAEHIQIAIRVVIVSTAMLYFFSPYFERNANNTEYITLTHRLVASSFAMTIALAIALLINPGVSVARRIVAMIHDITAVSAGIFLGESSAAAVVAVYFWATLGNGFRYGTPYLYGCAVMSFVGFGSVYWFSDYWRNQSVLSLNILILLAVIPPYVGKLLSSLHTAKADLRHQATVDGLTGLINRRELEQNVEAVLSQQQQGHFLIFCDLDHFKILNDVAGHAAGDKLLADIGKIIADCVRGDDLTARLGGDEFCVFVKNCPAKNARAIAENIRNSVSGYRLAWGTEYYSVGVSVGAAPSAAVKDMDSLFRLADASCYAAKNAGRNQIHLVDPTTDLLDTQVIRNLFTEKNSGDSPISPRRAAL